MCGGNPSAFCASRSVAHSDALFKVLKNSFFIQAFFIKKRSEKEILCSHLPFLVCRLQLDTAYNLRRIRKKCTRQPECKLAKATSFLPYEISEFYKKLQNFAKNFSEYRLLKAAESSAKHFILRAIIFTARHIFSGGGKEKDLKTASFNFYFKLVVRIPVPRQVLGLCGSRKKRRICAH